MAIIRLTAGTFRRAVLATLLLSVIAFAVVVLTAPSSQAASTNCTYYNNASYTTVVGQYGYDCCNNRVAWGTKTRYSRCGGCFVCYPPTP